MKVVVANGAGELAIQHIVQPEIKGDYDVLCENLYGTTCTGTDWHIINGSFPHPIQYPTIIGHESIGRAVVVGRKVRSFKPGDLITRVGVIPEDGTLQASWGGMSQYGIARDHYTMKLDGMPSQDYNKYRVNCRIPDGLIDPADAPMFITWRETLSYVKRMGVTTKSKVLISGSGANGFSIGKQAINLGASYVCLIGNMERSGVGEKLEFSDYLDYKDVDKQQAYIEKHIGYFDFIIDATGIAKSIDKYLKCIRPDGVISCYGKDDYQSYTIAPFEARTTFRFYNGGYDEMEAHQDVIDLIRNNRLHADAWLDKSHIFDIDDAMSAYMHVRNKRAIKAIVKLN